MDEIVAVESEVDGLGADFGERHWERILGAYGIAGDRAGGWDGSGGEACSRVASAYEKPMPWEDMGFEGAVRVDGAGPTWGTRPWRAVPRAADQK